MKRLQCHQNGSGHHPNDMARHWLNRQRLVVYSCAFLAVYVALWGYWILKLNRGVDSNGIPLGSDFITFWGASHLALSGKAVAAYDPQLILPAEQAAIPWVRFKAIQSWQYPPTFLLLVLPLALLPYFTSLLLFLGTTFAALAMALRRVLPQRAVLLPLLAFPGVFVNAGSGQNGFLTAALIAGALALLDTRPLLAGLLIGALTIKPQLGLLLPLALLCGRYWRVLACAALAAAAFLALSLAVLGPGTLQAFAARLPVTAQWLVQGNLPLRLMPSFYALTRLLGAPIIAAEIIQAASALFAAGAVAWIWLRCADCSLRAAGLIAGTLLASPYLYDYDLVWLAPALAWCVEYGLRRGWRPRERELLVAVWLLPGLALACQYLLHWQPSALLLLALLLMILRRAREEAAAQAAKMKNSGELSAMANSASRSGTPERAAPTRNGTSTGRM